MDIQEQRARAPDGYTRNGPAPVDHVLKLRIALVQNDPKGLEDKLLSVSTPGSPDHGNHLSKEEVEAFVSPKPESVSAVQSWLSSHAISSQAVSPAGDWLSINITVDQANALLDAEFSTFTHKTTGKQAVRTLSYSIPADLKAHLSFIHPTVAFPVQLVGSPVVTSKSKKQAAPTNSSPAADYTCAEQFTPTCAQDMYGIPATPAKQTSNRIAVSGFGDQWASQSDFQIFAEIFRPDLYNATFSVDLVDGGVNNQDSPGDEASLDVQYTLGVATGVPTEFVSVGSDNEDGIDGFLDILTTLLNEADTPNVLTTSYSFNEPDLPFSIANSLCNAYAQLGARGTSALFSSGDGGVGGGGSNTDCTTFIPTFPSTCPFVTSVGATDVFDSETGAAFSSGGFSNLFPIPSYQAADVTSYLKTIGNTNKGLFNASGRAFPDISARATSYQIIVNGFGLSVQGTSCSTPLLASLFALLNDELISAGKSPLGFLNPLIYANKKAFTDITTGTNPGCGTNGFSSAVGWDPVTGVGAPTYSALRAAAGL
ncbi:family S53 protease [Dentipellis sp. KUC8613]|nr:family S53 protease [Dentipellis sp. KUC8613]